MIVDLQASTGKGMSTANASRSREVPPSVTCNNTVDGSLAANTGGAGSSSSLLLSSLGLSDTKVYEP